MADGGNPIASLYPQPIAPAANGIANMNPLQVIGAANALTQLQTNRQTLAAKQATGAAYQGALQPDGSIDQSALAASLAGNPDAAFTMPETADRMLSQTTAQTALDAKRTAFIADAIGSTADDPDISPDKVRSLGVTLARNLKIPAPMINNLLDDLPKSKDALRAKVLQFRNLSIGSAGLSTPTDTGLTPEGAPITAPRGQYNYRTAGGGLPSALAPGESGLMEAAAKRAAILQGTADTSPQIRANLENLKAESKVLDNLGGPTFDVEKKLNQLSSRLAGIGITMTPEQLKAGESFDKVVNQISLQQGTAFGGTDAARSMSLGSTPNTSMSKMGRDAVISMAQGNQDMIDKARDAWLDARTTAQANGKKITAADYDLFMHGIGKQMDARVFQFNRLNRADQQKFLSQMPHSEVADFENNYRAAIHRGWVKDLK